MIKKLKPIHASVVIETRRPLGLFYVHENAVYVGIDNSAGHAWVEEFASLRQCKEWLRNPWMEAGPTACGENNGKSRIAKPEELLAVAIRQGIEMDGNEAGIVLGYLEGHDYCLMADEAGMTVRHDESEGEDCGEDMPYSVQDAVMFCQEMNGELILESESMSVPDVDYLARLHQDEQVFDGLMRRIRNASGQCKEAA